MTPQDLEILLNTANFRERPPEFALRLLEETCARTGLDWKARHLYLMNRAGKWGVTLSIDGFRLIGAQDASYAGQEGPFWTTGPTDPWGDIPPEKAPYASKVGIVKRDGTVTWGVAKYGDYNAGNPMWTKFASTMVAKCAEMLAWRKAFPGKLGGLYGTEEMDQALRGGKSSHGVSAESEAEETTGANIEAQWHERIEGARDLATLKVVGADIMRDKAIGTEVLARLHARYNERKNLLSHAAG